MERISAYGASISRLRRLYTHVHGIRPDSYWLIMIIRQLPKISNRIRWYNRPKEGYGKSDINLIPLKHTVDGPLSHLWSAYFCAVDLSPISDDLRGVTLQSVIRTAESTIDSIVANWFYVSNRA